ncbi:MAG: GNAT family N-acetyltransferase [Armatimonadetes bacterium]|nr:GNAT family N-acetyltransferase [Armatimonadota bacterium]
MTVTYRDYDHDRDLDAAVRIWKEVGWLAKDEEERLGWYIEGSRGMIAEVAGSAECFVLMTDGTMRYLDRDLPMAACTGVTTGRVARQAGLARRLLSRSLAAEVARGAVVSALGVFEQGFYDALGYGAGTYSLRGRFDPGQLRTTIRPRPALRVGPNDWEEAHAARLARRRTHGCCNLLPPGISRMEMADAEKGFGIGYRDAPGSKLSHYIWVWSDNVEQGPYRAELIYRTPDELTELLALLKSLSDQVLSVSVREPPGMMLQDWLNRPIRHMNVTEDSKHESRITACAYWQVRILDLDACIAAARVEGAPVRLNLNLRDPADRYYDECGWKGIGGSYVLTLGQESTCRPGADPSLPTLDASVNAFSRMWLGVCPASGLAIADDLRGPDELLERLDVAFRLPVPQPDWDF